MPRKKTIYPVFLPHAGCPFQCIYCNQHAVVGVGPTGHGILAEANMRLELYAEQVRNSHHVGEVAFYGGTFTALPKSLLRTILGLAGRFVDEGLFTGVRFSTRPDCLDDDICQILSEYPVTTVELGVQSFIGPVLDASRRGYSPECARGAAARVKQYGWALGIQLMAGLPEDNASRFLESVWRTVVIRPDFVRIYPTLVLNGTPLAGLYRSGTYRPLEMEEAMEWVVPAYDLLVSASVPVTRMGLHADAALEAPGVMLAGPYHPAFGYLVRCRWWRNRVDAAMESLGTSAPDELLVRAAPNHVSEVVGQGKTNIEYWKARWGLRNMAVRADSELAGIEMLMQGYY
ncbi:MAG: radical SAM protein [Syntrophobacter sp.]